MWPASRQPAQWSWTNFWCAAAITVFESLEYTAKNHPIWGSCCELRQWHTSYSRSCLFFFSCSALQSVGWKAAIPLQFLSSPEKTFESDNMIFCSCIHPSPTERSRILAGKLGISTNKTATKRWIDLLVGHPYRSLFHDLQHVSWSVDLVLAEWH